LSVRKSSIGHAESMSSQVSSVVGSEVLYRSCRVHELSSVLGCRFGSPL
jgi:hypothetical protein